MSLGVSKPKVPVVLISESMAQAYWPDEDPIGKRLSLSFTPEIRREVVGVVGDVKLRGVGVLEPVPMIYTSGGNRRSAWFIWSVSWRRTLIEDDRSAASSDSRLFLL